MGSYRLTNEAKADLREMYRYGFLEHGEDQADQYYADMEAAFDLLASNPNIARERLEITPPVRIHPRGSHVIVYIIEKGGDVLIIRVRHGRDDWKDNPAG